MFARECLPSAMDKDVLYDMLNREDAIGMTCIRKWPVRHYRP